MSLTPVFEIGLAFNDLTIFNSLQLYLHFRSFLYTSKNRRE